AREGQGRGEDPARPRPCARRRRRHRHSPALRRTGMATVAVDTPLHLTDADLAAVVQLVYEKSGITLHDGKRALIVARLQGRVRKGGFPSFAAYLKAVAAD